MTLYVISGHGDGDPGACGNGYREADVVRQVSSRLKALGGDSVVELDKSVNWYASRRVNSDLKRLVGNDPVIELHTDSAGASARGGHVIIKSGFKADAYDVALADFVADFFPGRADRIVARNDLGNVNRAASNGINYRLLECCFITNQGDISKLMGEMDAFCAGVLAAFGIGAASGTGTAGWVRNATGWWWQESDGTWPANEWKLVNGEWFWFDSRGYAIHDCCREIGDKWYAFDSRCAMKTSVEVTKSGALVL